MVKVHPNTPSHADHGIALTAAKNEFQSFQVVVNGADTGASHVSATFSSLTGAGTIGGADVTLYREAFINVTTPTFPTAAKGLYPDALIPDVDEIAGEKRNAFPFDVPAGEARAIWVDIHVPANAAPGDYSGTVAISGTNVSAQIPVTLKVIDAAMPSTSSLSTAFLLFTGNVCAAHTGSGDCGANINKQIDLVARYQKMGLEHRITLSNPFVLMPPGSDWSSFDQAYAQFLDGTVQTRLAGAKMTTAQYPGQRNASQYANFAQHFAAKGWLSRAYDYTADEPPYGVSFSTAQSRAAMVRSAAPNLRTLITTTYQDAQSHGLLGDIDVMVPVVNWIYGQAAPYTGDQRSLYGTFATPPAKELWIYQSCMSQGCAYGTTAPENTGTTGWPSYMIDASAAKNRAMQWIDFEENVNGELYYETALSLPNAWSNQYQFNGNGEGNLFYPGTPATIGGTTDVPVASIRMKLLRLGMQDYEWLKMVSDAGDASFASTTAKSVVPTPYQVPDDGTAFDTARAQLIARYATIKGLDSQPPPTPTPTPTPTPDGGTGTGSGSGSGSGNSGSGSGNSGSGSGTTSSSNGVTITPNGAGQAHGCSATSGATMPFALLLLLAVTYGARSLRAVSRTVARRLGDSSEPQ